MAWPENTDGQGGAWNEHPLGTGGDFHSLAVADSDWGGDVDVFACDSEVGTGPWRWYIWENEAGKFCRTRRHVVLDGGLGGHEARAADVDGDGDIDVCAKPWQPDPRNAPGAGCTSIT